jgi:hypothetical protein
VVQWNLNVATSPDEWVVKNAVVVLRSMLIAYRAVVILVWKV